MADSCFYAHVNIVEQSTATKRYKYEIDRETLELIKSEKRRTGKGPAKLIRDAFHISPPELSAEIVNNWISGRTKKAYWEHVDWVLARYAKLPNKVPITT